MVSTAAAGGDYGGGTGAVARPTDEGSVGVKAKNVTIGSYLTARLREE